MVTTTIALPYIFLYIKQKNSMNSNKICILFGGPSSERAISLNSARSLSDHLDNLVDLEVLLVFVSHDLKFYVIDKIWLYCNTIEDFEFKLQNSSLITEDHFFTQAKRNKWLIWPVIHGAYGEDGTLQHALEQHNIPFVGSPSSTCKKVFKKSSALSLLETQDLLAAPFLCLKEPGNFDEISLFLKKYNHCVCKPDNGGSSLGVFTFRSKEEFFEKWSHEKKYYSESLLIEKFHTGTEFSIVVLEYQGQVTPLIPCSIHYEKEVFFDYRKKYLATNDSSISCPARFTSATIDKIRALAKSLFQSIGAQDLLRLDGWVLEDQKIAFSDFNMNSGLEQNSLLFLQAATAQISHLKLCQTILAKYFDTIYHNKTERIFVLMGGTNAEKQVSLMSGTNVWLKLKDRHNTDVSLFFVRSNGLINKIHEDVALYHTCEEIEKKLYELEKQTHPSYLATQQLLPEGIKDLPKTKIAPFSQEEFCQYAKQSQAFVFLALHGGQGEDGTWQKKLELHNLCYNGSPSQTSKLCMDKYQTGLLINEIGHDKLSSLNKLKVNRDNYLPDDVEKFIKQYEKVIIKPLSDGCSSGVCVLCHMGDFTTYFDFIKQKKSKIPKGTLSYQPSIVEITDTKTFILEPFIETIGITQARQRTPGHSGWIELTCGLLESQGRYKILPGSQTVTQDTILTLEEKFQSGTGTNITPCDILTSSESQQIKNILEIAAKKLNIKNYARFDIFYQLQSGKVIFIEANTLPALTPSTVLFHQALAEGMTPVQLLETIIKGAKNEKELSYALKDNKMSSQCA